MTDEAARRQEVKKLKAKDDTRLAVHVWKSMAGRAFESKSFLLICTTVHFLEIFARPYVPYFLTAISRCHVKGRDTFYFL